MNIYKNPKTMFVSDFIGESNILKGVVTCVNEKTATIDVGNALKIDVINDGYSVNTDFGEAQYVVDVDTAREVSAYMIKLFQAGTIDELHGVYTHMESAISLKPRTCQSPALSCSEL